MAAEMVDDLYIPASRASRLVDNIVAYMTGNPVEDADWEAMSQRLEAILTEFTRTLQENDLPAPDFTPAYPENPYL